MIGRLTSGVKKFLIKKNQVQKREGFEKRSDGSHIERSDGGGEIEVEKIPPPGTNFKSLNQSFLEKVFP